MGINLFCKSNTLLDVDVTVIQQLLNLSFWIDSLETNDDMIFYGNLTTTNRTMSLTLENFAHNIDNGAPSPSESGEFHNLCGIPHNSLLNILLFSIFIINLCIDECLAELLNDAPCTVSKRCLQIMSLNNDSHGYHLTHK